MRRLFVLALVFFTFVSGSALAEPLTYGFDKKHTQILFFVNHMGFSNSNGKFLGFDGSFTFDEARPQDGHVEVTIDTNSLNMDDGKWEEHLKSKDFFNVETYPSMTFKSTKVEMTGEKNRDADRRPDPAGTDQTGDAGRHAQPLRGASDEQRAHLRLFRARDDQTLGVGDDVVRPHGQR